MKKLLIAMLTMVMFVSCTTVSLDSLGYTDLGNGVYEKYDPFSEATVYNSQSSVDLYSEVNTYISIINDGKHEFTYLNFKYRGSDWIFFDNATLINNYGGNLSYDCDDTDREVVTGSGVSVRETGYAVLDEKEKQELLDFINQAEDGVINMQLRGKKFRNQKW